MKGIVRSHIAVCLLSVLVPFTTIQAYEYVDECCDWWLPYLGVDAGARLMRYDNTSGGNLLPTNYAQVNLYGGVKFCDLISLEAGYETTPTHTSTVTIGPGAHIFGRPQSPTSTSIQYIRTQIKGWHIDVVGSYEIYEPCDLEILASVGIERPKITIYNYIYALDGVGLADPFEDDNRRFFTARKTVLRLGLGLQRMWTDCVGARFKVNWSNTSQFKTLYNQVGIVADPALTRRARPQDSWSFMVGIFSYF